MSSVAWTLLCCFATDVPFARAGAIRRTSLRSSRRHRRARTWAKYRRRAPPIMDSVKIAWFSPWPPQRSGIAGRSAELVPLLAARARNRRVRGCRARAGRARSRHAAVGRRAACPQRSRVRMAAAERSLRPACLPDRQLPPAPVHLAVPLPLSGPCGRARRARASCARGGVEVRRTVRRLRRGIGLESSGRWPGSWTNSPRGARRACSTSAGR